jgi:hypothetical protein
VQPSDSNEYSVVEIIFPGKAFYGSSWLVNIESRELGQGIRNTLDMQNVLSITNI